MSPWTWTPVIQPLRFFYVINECDKCTKYQCFMSWCDTHRCLCRAAVRYQSHSHALLSSSSSKCQVLSEKLQPRYFLWCWLAFTARSPRTTSTKSHFCRWQLFSLCDPPRSVQSSEFPRGSACRRVCVEQGTDMAVHADCLHTRTNGWCQTICYVPLQKKKKKKMFKWFIPYKSLPTTQRP